ncbi:hypothetical protein McpSp1_03100 [Methanocorpusculaceae archaeon Sp1]|nr:hypothetical protein [Methanocorpusculaceae archaeon Sp1]
MTKNTRKHPYHCPVEAAFDRIGGRWKASIIWIIGYGSIRYSKIKDTIPNITAHMLSLQLKSLEEDGLIIRTQYEEIPPRVEYCLTESGLALLPILSTLCDWAALHYPDQIPAGYIRKNPGGEICPDAHPSCSSGTNDQI